MQAKQSWHKNRFHFCTNKNWQFANLWFYFAKTGALFPQQQSVTLL